MQNFFDNLTYFIKDANRGQNDKKERKKKRYRKVKIPKIKTNMRILREKIPWIRVKMTEENREFSRQSNTIRLKMQINNKIKNKSKNKMPFESETLENLEKIWKFQGKKLSEFKLKWPEKTQNFLHNPTPFDWKCKSTAKWRKKRAKNAAKSEILENLEKICEF